ncbi:MAG: hypothetical protein GY839_11940 [candidate division Zixibacteria bacterium]|nr:hypothetical protein [candidate division Zixibacteria bacterium]
MKEILKIILIFAITVPLAFSLQIVDKSDSTIKTGQKTSQTTNELDTAKAEDKVSPNQKARKAPIGGVKSIPGTNSKMRHRLYGSLNEGLTAAEPVEKVYQYLELRKEKLGLDEPRSELVVTSVKISPEGTGGISLSQKVNGVNVRAGTFGFGFKAGKLFLVNDKLMLEAKEVNTNPSISQEQAINIALSTYSPPDSILPAAQIKAIKFEIAKINDEYKLVWFITAMQGKTIGGHYLLDIDAQTGEILSKRHAGIK